MGFPCKEFQRVNLDLLLCGFDLYRQNFRFSLDPATSHLAKVHTFGALLHQCFVCFPAGQVRWVAEFLYCWVGFTGYRR